MLFRATVPIALRAAGAPQLNSGFRPGASGLELAEPRREANSNTTPVDRHENKKFASYRVRTCAAEATAIHNGVLSAAP